jgi:hypothetical protein
MVGWYDFVYITTEKFSTYFFCYFVYTESGRLLNPVQVAFQLELTRFVKYVTRKAELGTRWKKPDEEAYARGLVILVLNTCLRDALYQC